MDEQDSVRLLIVGACVDIAKILPQEHIESDVSDFRIVSECNSLNIATVG